MGLLTEDFVNSEPFAFIGLFLFCGPGVTFSRVLPFFFFLQLYSMGIG